MSFYISWTDYTAKSSGRAIKEVACDKCKAEYLYVIERTAEAQATTFYHLDEEGTRDRSQERAQEKLQRFLANDFDLVPCPACFSYQPQMVAFLKRAHHFSMFLLAMILFLLAGVTLLIGGIWAISSAKDAPTGRLALISLGLVVVGIFLILLRSSFAERFDPNAGDPQECKRIAESRAMLKKDLRRP